jgi:hypothetical protein
MTSFGIRVKKQRRGIPPNFMYLFGPFPSYSLCSMSMAIGVAILSANNKQDDGLVIGSTKKSGSVVAHILQ